MMKSIQFCLIILLLTIVGHHQGQRIATNSSAILDSINRDLDELKSSISKTLNSPRFNSSSYIFRTNVNSNSSFDTDLEDSHTHFLVDLNQDRPFVQCSTPNDGDSLWKFSIPFLNESDGLLRFREFRGKPLLLVNVATFCESTIEYPIYNQLKDKYGDQLIIIGFPSNNFLNQEPTGDATEIYNAIKYVRPGNGFVPKFPLTERIDVNGLNQHKIYKFLKRCCPSTRTRFNANEEKLLYKPKNARDIRWNFEKFLIHPITGYPVKRYDQKYLPDRIIPDIDRLLEETRQNSATDRFDAPGSA
ncbi:Glutathione peroxidase 6 [Dermatophagoides farinae]|uniref:Glutathione peroxidase n=2 Tax=Dermatophagoides farinae TaxID=6954 RepID=A0A922HF09_DERFA|nr:glutathione peroxidase-like [Dermatophagoides farinae]KAH9491017.1 Glutathione peroxidase 6 [Dermatophagoides farinae]KAH9521514.1 Glutathione peroxidase 6 [Dermatophagoides farinae]